jgi:hypothetical protein
MIIKCSTKDINADQIFCLYHFKTASVIAILFIIFMSAQILPAQPVVELPKEINIKINGIELTLTSGWIDSLVDAAYDGKIYYKIIGAKKSQYYVTTVVQIPQILDLNDVLRQIILYYSLLQNETSREGEILTIYPYFKSMTEDPSLKVQYNSKGKYEINLLRWNPVSVPDQPIPEHKYIFNQIIQTSFSGLQSLGDVPDEVFQEIAEKNNLSTEQVRRIYQNTILWQVGNQYNSE